VLVIGVAIGVEHRADQRPQAGPRHELCVDRAHRIQQILQMRVQDIKQQILLADVIMIEQRLRHAGRGRDLRHRGAVIAVLGEELRRAAQDLAPFAVMLC
jgi:hypothetical protein